MVWLDRYLPSIYHNLTKMNEVGDDKLGITFTGEVGSTVHFLDVSVTLQGDGKIHTKLYVKPTDASRYLHRRSDHGKHTFQSIPYSQFRKAVVLSSDSQDRQ